MQKMVTCLRMKTNESSKPNEDSLMNKKLEHAIKGQTMKKTGPKNITNR